MTIHVYITNVRIVGFMQIHIHRFCVMTRRPANQLSHRLPVGDFDKLVDDHVGFELAFNLMEVIERDTDKSVYGRVRIFGIQRCGLTPQM